MRDARAIVDAASKLFEQRVPFLLATVVKIGGSSYRRPGARLLATAEGRVAGSVSGGCLEGDLIRTGFWRTRSGPVVIRYDSSDPNGPEAVLGCGGVIDILVEQARGRTEDHPLAVIEQVLSSERRAMMATVYRSTDPDIALGTRYWTSEGRILASSGVELAERIFAAHTGERAASRPFETARGEVEVLVESIIPPPHLFVMGSGLDALAVVRAVRQLGWTVTVWSASPSFAVHARFEGTGAAVEGNLDKVRAQIDACDRALALIMAHNQESDRASLGMALESRAQYIGVLGPRHRTETLLEEPLAARLFEDPRLRAPVGLDLGAETPEEIAVAIAAEMLASLHGGSGEPLRRRGVIHGDRD
jgi:xanthine dehydrogenase accessory factor